MNEAILAYTAGIIDGEGYIGIVKTSKNYFSRVLCVAMKYPKIPKFLFKHWGGTFYITKKGICVWTGNNTKGDKVLEKILVHLIEKKQQAKLFLKSSKLAKSSYRKGKDTPKQISEKHKLYLQLKELHN